MNIQEQFIPFRERMEAAGLQPPVIQAFQHYYEQLVSGQTGLIPESEIAPPGEIPDAEQVSTGSGREALARTVVIKLNGGLGTSMGLEKAKSLLLARDGLTFLDIIARQVLYLRQETGAPIPLVLMNSFSTHEDSLKALARYPELESVIPLAFLQNKEPKILQENFQPASWPMDRDLEWCPPGHGDLYIALQTSGILQKLLDGGFEFAFVSNSDNLGAILDEGILGYFAENRFPFLMEVADRTEADKKGGHLAHHRDGRLLLREVAQCPPEEMDSFSDIHRYRYFNTNNIWLHLPSLKDALATHGGILKLPLIRNSKTLDPRDSTSPKVYQLETAMGAAIEVFPGAGALRVPRTRFAPVKLCSDLLALWSDAYQLTPESHVVPNPSNRYGIPVVKLDSKFYKFVDQLQQRFPNGAPSLKDCESFTVEGDVRFGSHIVAHNRVAIRNPGSAPATVPDGSVLEGDVVVTK